MDSKILVNGPVNTVRLEGNVQGKKKIFYSMFDFHVNKGKCDDIHSIDVDKFLVEEFEKLSKMKPDMTFDLMVEIGLIRPYFHNLYKNNYISRIGHLFSKTFEIDKQNNKVKKSGEIPNVRFHYTDVRDIMPSNYFSYTISPPLYPFDKEYLSATYRKIAYLRQMRVETYYTLYHTKSTYNPVVRQSIFDFSKTMHNSGDNIDKMSKEDIDKQIKKMIFKLRNKYENESVKKTINHIIDTDLKNMLEKFIDDLDRILDEISIDIDIINEMEENQRNILIYQPNGTYDYGYSLKNKINFLSRTKGYEDAIYEEVYIGLMFMDLYKLRRFLDKDYITNAISYAGGHHSNNYVRMLVKYFGFKITNYSYLGTDSIESAYKFINESKRFDDLDCIFFPKIFTQCSDLTSFPELFT